MEKDLSFRISSALKSIIGKDLITDNFAAIFELVKNSFDAEAKDVKVVFDLDNSTPKICIVDDGYGMSEDDLYNKWLFLAHSAKKEGYESKTRRTFAGYKGIGRFSCDRLGAKLRIQSKTVDENKVHNLRLNWGAFEEDSKVEFKDIHVHYEVNKNFELTSGIKAPSHGVVIEISELREPESWSRPQLIRLRRSLSKLVSPFQKSKSSGKIELVCERELTTDKQALKKIEPDNSFSNTVNGVIENDILNVLEGKTTSLEANITNDGQLVVRVSDRGELIYRTTEDISTTFPSLIDTDFSARISFLNKSAKNVFARRMGVPSVQYGSLFLLRNGFQVYPVGEEDDDYWGLNRRKQQGYARFLGTREIVGFVSVSGDEENFRESSSRDKGLIETSASLELDGCVKLCIKKLEAYVVDIVWKDKLDDNLTADRITLDSNRIKIIQLVEKLASSKNVEVLEFNHDLIRILDEKHSDFDQTLMRLKSIAGFQSDNELLEEIKRAETAYQKAKASEIRAREFAEKEAKARREAETQAKASAERAIKAEQKVISTQTELEEAKKQTLFLMGSSSRDKDVLEGFLHQIVIYASNAKVQLEEISSDLGDAYKSLPDAAKDLLNNLREINDKIITSSRFATHGNFRMNSDQLDGHNIVEFIYEYIKNIAKAYASRIRIQCEFPTIEFNTSFKPIELGMAIENLIDNAKKARASIIEFEFLKTQKGMQVNVTDNGRGISQTITEPNRIFEKGFSRTDGSGMGLYFCKQTIESINGSISLAKQQPPTGTQLSIQITK